jgi:peptide/nickel transport system permease protein
MANTPQASISLNEKAWRRLKKNTGALFGLGVIVIALVLSLLAYVIAPDNSRLRATSRYCNLKRIAPGFSIDVLQKAERPF